MYWRLINFFGKKIIISHLLTFQRNFKHPRLIGFRMTSKLDSEIIRKLAQPYYFQSEANEANTLVILVHGFGASATETRPLGEFLRSKGFDVLGILLEGHGTTPRDLDAIKWEDWFENIRDIYEKNIENYDNLFIGGVSLGGALSLYASTKIKFKGVFTINALYRYSFIYKILARFLQIFRFHKPRNPTRIEWYLEKGLFAYHEDCVHAAYEVMKFLKILNKRVKLIEIPALIIQSLTDKTVSPKSGEWISNDLQSRKELLIIPEGDHILTVDPNREVAFDKIEEFIRKLLSEN